MKFICETRIARAKDAVVELWADESRLPDWQPGFVRQDHLAGKPGEPGARTRVVLEQNDRPMELIATVVENNLPDSMTVVYEHEHMTNTLVTRFESVDPGVTRYVAEVEYTMFNGFLPRIMAAMFPDMFRKQNQAWLERFREFAEAEIAADGD